MKHGILVLFAIILSMTIATNGFGQGSGDMGKSPFIKDYIGQVHFVEGQLLALEQAMVGKENWRPMEGVRSVSETYLHVAFGNYALTKFMGFEPPADVNFSMDLKKWDAQSTDLTKIADIMKASFEHVRGVANKITAAQMEEKMDLFGTEMTKRNAMLSALNHMHEHLGQSIAYARMNKVVPPWTAAEKAAEKEKEGKDGK